VLPLVWKEIYKPGIKQGKVLMKKTRCKRDPKWKIKKEKKKAWIEIVTTATRHINIIKHILRKHFKVSWENILTGKSLDV
jgi:hypothetical protein